MKTCSKCKQSKHINEFSRDARAVDGLRSDCKACSKSYHAAWRSNNPEKQRSRVQDWRAENPDRAKELRREAMNRAYAANPDKYRERSRKLAADNKDARAAKQARRRAAGYCVWANDTKIREVYEFAQEFRTAGFDVEVDHIEPLQGKTVCGLHVENNLRVCLATANLRKGNRQMEQFE